MRRRVSRILLHISHQFFQLLLLQLHSLMNIAKSKMLKACQAPWCTAHRYSSFPATSHILPVSLPNVHSLLAAELGSKSSDRGARVNIHIYWAEGSFLLPFERMQHFIRINFRTLGRRTSLLFGAKEKSILIEGSHRNIPAIRIPFLQESCSARRVFASQDGLVLVSKP